MTAPYRGRIAPSPTGYLHLGHAATFWTAFERARQTEGTLLLRNEDLDFSRCRPEYVEAMFEDLRWFGIDWEEGPDIGGLFAPYDQSARRQHYVDGWQQLLEGGFIYPCTCSRRDVLQAAGAPHGGDDEPLYPGFCRPGKEETFNAQPPTGKTRSIRPSPDDRPARPDNTRRGVSWRFRVPDGEEISFEDGGQGRQSFVAGHDFGDFVVWRKDDLPAYQLAVVLDDAAMEITEVVRGEDLLLSTARQILLYRALGRRVPRFYHCPLIVDDEGARLAKRHESLSLRALRQQGATPDELRETILDRRGIALKNR